MQKALDSKINTTRRDVVKHLEEARVIAEDATEFKAQTRDTFFSNPAGEWQLEKWKELINLGMITYDEAYNYIFQSIDFALSHEMYDVTAIAFKAILSYLGIIKSEDREKFDLVAPQVIYKIDPRLLDDKGIESYVKLIDTPQNRAAFVESHSGDYFAANLYSLSLNFDNLDSTKGFKYPYNKFSTKILQVLFNIGFKSQVIETVNESFPIHEEPEMVSFLRRNGYSLEIFDSLPTNDSSYEATQSVEEDIDFDYMIRHNPIEALDWLREHRENFGQVNFRNHLLLLVEEGLTLEVFSLITNLSREDKEYLVLDYTLLGELAQKGLVDEVRSLVEEIQPGPEDKSMEFLNNMKNDLIKTIKEPMAAGGISNPVLEQKLEHLIFSLGYAEVKFLGLILSKYSFFSDKFLAFLKGEIEKIEIDKDDSLLEVYRDGRIVNTVPEKSAQIWYKLQESGAQVVQINSIREVGDGNVEVDSGYAGIPIPELLEMLGFLDNLENKIDGSLFDFLSDALNEDWIENRFSIQFDRLDLYYSYRSELIRELSMQGRQMLDEIWDRGIYIEDPHLKNLTFILVEPTYLEAHLQKEYVEVLVNGRVIRQKPSKSNIPYNPKYITDDISKYSEGYRPILRLIDIVGVSTNEDLIKAEQSPRLAPAA